MNVENILSAFVQQIEELIECHEGAAVLRDLVIQAGGHLEAEATLADPYSAGIERVARGVSEVAKIVAAKQKTREPGEDG